MNIYKDRGLPPLKAYSAGWNIVSIHMEHPVATRVLLVYYYGIWRVDFKTSRARKVS